MGIRDHFSSKSARVAAYTLAPGLWVKGPVGLTMGNPVIKPSPLFRIRTKTHKLNYIYGGKVQKVGIVAR